jgi:uncharacterized protein YydD (DUF2326 family)
MIHNISIYKSINLIRSIDLKDSDVNLIVVDTKESSSIHDSRNATGKTSLVSIVDYCLGRKLIDLPEEYFKDWKFQIIMDLNGTKYRVLREFNSSTIYVSDIIPDTSKDAEYIFNNDLAMYELSLSDWLIVLGKSVFDIDVSFSDKLKPTFRSLNNYFIRIGSSEYNNAFKIRQTDNKSQIGVRIAYLLGMHWTSIYNLANLKKSFDSVKLKKDFLRDQGFKKVKAEGEKFKLEKKIELAKQELSSFKVNQNYKNIEIRADQITRELHRLSKENIYLEQQISSYEEMLKKEKYELNVDIVDLYESTLKVLSKDSLKTINDVNKFHHDIVENRKSFLEKDILEFKDKINNNKLIIDDFIEKRASLLKVLESEGALEEFNYLRSLLDDSIKSLNKINDDLELYLDSESKYSELKDKESNEIKYFNKCYEEESSLRKDSLLLFSEFTTFLYDDLGGNLYIEKKEISNTYDISEDVPRSDSGGIGKMVVFCFDLMLAVILAKRGKSRILIHDSTIFEGVDSRQQEQAINLARDCAKKYNFQYLCTLNTGETGIDNAIRSNKDAVRLTMYDNAEESLFKFHWTKKTS